MQNLLSDIHPGFAVPEFAYIGEFDVNTNGYDFRVGPCSNRRRLTSDPKAHRAGWVPLEEISEEDLHPDVLALPYEEADDDDIDDGDFDYHRQKPDHHHDRYSEMWERYGFTDEDDQAALAAPSVAPAGNEIFDARNYDAFPSVIGAHKFAELRHPKVCTLKMACRTEESHGRRGRKKQLWWSALAHENSGKREMMLRP